jgi:hypothetical protein
MSVVVKNKCLSFWALISESVSCFSSHYPALFGRLMGVVLASFIYYFSSFFVPQMLSFKIVFWPVVHYFVPHLDWLGVLYGLNVVIISLLSVFAGMISVDYFYPVLTGVKKSVASSCKCSYLALLCRLPGVVMVIALSMVILLALVAIGYGFFVLVNFLPWAVFKALLAFLGYLCLVGMFFYTAIHLSLAVFVYLCDRVSIVHSLKASYKLVKGRFFNVFFLYVLLLCAAYIFTILMISFAYVVVMPLQEVLMRLTVVPVNYLLYAQSFLGYGLSSWFSFAFLGPLSWFIMFSVYLNAREVNKDYLT